MVYYNGFFLIINSQKKFGFNYFNVMLIFR